MTCNHEHATDSRAYPYSGSVAVHPYTDENRAAHGNCMYVETCDHCGARRRRNVNGWHVEYGTWGETRAEREQRARQLQAEARAALASVPELRLTGPNGRSATVRVDSEGYVCTEGAEWDELQGTLLGTEWFARAVAARQAVLRAESEG